MVKSSAIGAVVVVVVDGVACEYVAVVVVVANAVGSPFQLLH